MTIVQSLSSLISKSAFTIIDQQNNNVITAKLSIKKVSIKYASKVMRHAMENGKSLVDARIIQPKEVEIEVICPNVSVLNQVNEMVGNNKTLYTITSKGIVTTNLIAEGQQIRLDSSMLSATPIKIRFKEVLVNLTQEKPKQQAADSSLVGKGISMLKEQKQNVTDLLQKVKSNVINSVGGIGGG